MNRTCGTCSECCSRLPVRELNKGANERCAHQRHGHGCKIYRGEGFPISCRFWTCKWLTDTDTAAMSRPDRSGYVIDVMPDYIVITAEDGHKDKIGALQVWCDPKRRDAHRDPALRAYLSRQADQGFVAVIRYSARDAFVLFAPQFTGGRGWQEMHTAMAEVEHTAADIVEALGEGWELKDLSQEAAE